jgi:eukaryotic-like serine/threonine-protein kinase
MTELEFDGGDAIRRMDGGTSWDKRRHLGELGGTPLR